ncbi:MarR family winged helix-turn-helix transcriptional regulator [Scrofimicrobium sp. R131]|uniref:MarR family transcriptional regulator n=1 Tax=Scrofimicrobium appendicitidis TaxID=3079930 RepID=A0AAU7V673_9ACTO
MKVDQQNRAAVDAPERPSSGGCPAALPRPLNGEEMAAWEALRGVSLGLSDLLSEDLASYTDLSLSEYDVLMRLADAPERRMRMAALAKESHLSPSRLSHMVERFEKRGLAARSMCPKDRRGIECVLTDAGVELLSSSAEQHFAMVRQRVLSHYTQEELGQLSALLDRLAHRSEE